MPQNTVLQIVKDILSETDLDDVSTWDETIQSEQIGNMIKTVFYEFHQENEVEYHREFANPTAATGNTYYTIPADITDIYWIKWDDGTSTRKDLIELQPKEFVEKLDTSGTAIADPNTGVSLEFNVSTDPSYWMRSDHEHICIDSYDTTPPAVGEILMYVSKEPTITLADATVPDIPVEAAALFLATVKARCFVLFHGEVNPYVETTRRKLEAVYSRKEGNIRTPKYGRRTRTSRRGE